MADKKEVTPDTFYVSDLGDFQHQTHTAYPYNDIAAAYQGAIKRNETRNRPQLIQFCTDGAHMELIGIVAYGQVFVDAPFNDLGDLGLE